MQKSGGEPPLRPKRTSRAGRKRPLSRNASRPATSEPRALARAELPRSCMTFLGMPPSRHLEASQRRLTPAALSLVPPSLLGAATTTETDMTQPLISLHLTPLGPSLKKGKPL